MKGEFSDINGNSYKVQIGIGDTPITLAGNPFTTESESDLLYKPVKYQSATVRIISDDYLFDIYSASAQGTKVELKDEDNNVIWTGYVTPNLYDMGFDEHREEI